MLYITCSAQENHPLFLLFKQQQKFYNCKWEVSCSDLDTWKFLLHVAHHSILSGRGGWICRYVDSIPAWGKQLEADLHVGKTEVTFWAHSPIGNSSASCSVIVYVQGKPSHHITLGNAFKWQKGREIHQNCIDFFHNSHSESQKEYLINQQQHWDTDDGWINHMLTINTKVTTKKYICILW